MNRNHRIALVAGAGSGIGAATALLLAKTGSHVCCADLDLSAAEVTARAAVEQGGTVSAHALDMPDEPQWESVLLEIGQAHGPPGILVNCAGIPCASPLTETSLTERRSVFATNLDGAFLATKHGMRFMSKAGV